MGEFWYLLVLAWKTLYFSVFRVPIVCTFFLFGNKSWKCPSAKLCFMNLKESIFRRSFKVWSPKTWSASKYETYFSSKTSLQNVFWVLSRSFSFSVVSPLFQTAQDCSKMLKQNVFHKWTISSLLEPKLHTLLKSCILALTFLMAWAKSTAPRWSLRSRSFGLFPLIPIFELRDERNDGFKWVLFVVFLRLLSKLMCTNRRLLFHGRWLGRRDDEVSQCSLVLAVRGWCLGAGLWRAPQTGSGT